MKWVCVNIVKEGMEMPYDDETIQKQLRNLKRKIVDSVHKSSPKKVIQLALFNDIKVPKGLLDECYYKESND